MYYVEKKGVSLCGTDANVTMLKKQRRQSEKLLAAISLKTRI